MIKQLGLLTPAWIRENRELLGLTQKQMALRLGIAEATLSRWETGGQIQQRALDKLLRLFFGLPQVRSALSDDGSVKDLSAASPTASGVNGLERDVEAMSRFSRLARALNGLPAEKEEAVIEQLQRLVELMKSE